jgi:exopolyphosphatase / guanosine-5'-triphosphate,3'-diphosphate pyrophosphatase
VVDNTKPVPLTLIDVGSNGIRFALVGITPHGYQVYYKKRMALRLGADVFKFGDLGPVTRSHLLRVFHHFKIISDDAKSIKIVCVATSALRNAHSRESICEEIAAKTGIHAQIISGAEEADLIYQALSFHHCFNNAPHILMDIGGGSVELSVLKDKQLLLQRSFPVGTVRILQHPEEMQKFDTFFEQFFNDLGETFKVITMIGTGGNFRAWGKLAKDHFHLSDSSRELLPDHLRQIYSEIKDWSIEEIIKKLKVRKDRAEVLVPSYLMIEKIMNTLPVIKIRCPKIGLIDGIAYQEMKNHFLLGA